MLNLGPNSESIPIFQAGGFCTTVTAGATSSTVALNDPDVRLLKINSSGPIHLNVGDSTVTASTNSTYIEGSDVSVLIEIPASATHVAIIGTGLMSLTVRISEQRRDWAI